MQLFVQTYLLKIYNRCQNSKLSAFKRKYFIPMMTNPSSFLHGFLLPFTMTIFLPLNLSQSKSESFWKNLRYYAKSWTPESAFLPKSCHMQPEYSISPILHIILHIFLRIFFLYYTRVGFEAQLGFLWNAAYWQMSDRTLWQNGGTQST